MRQINAKLTNDPKEIFIEKMQEKISRKTKKKLNSSEIISLQQKADDAVKALLEADATALSRVDIEYSLKRRLLGGILGTEDHEKITTGLIHIATYLQLTFYIEALVKYGANVNLVDGYGMTPLHYLAFSSTHNQTECLQALQKNNNLRNNILNNQGYSAFSLLGCAYRTYYTSGNISTDDGPMPKEVAVGMLHDLDFSEHDLKALVRTTPSVFKALAKKDKRLNNVDIQAKILNIVPKKSYDKYMPLYMYLAFNKKITKENAIKIFNFFSNPNNFHDFFDDYFGKNLLHRIEETKKKNYFTTLCAMLPVVKNSPRIFNDMVDENNNTILHHLFNIFSTVMNLNEFEFNEIFKERFYNHIFPLLEVYRDSFSKKNKLGQIPLFSVISLGGKNYALNSRPHRESIAKKLLPSCYLNDTFLCDDILWKRRWNPIDYFFRLLLSNKNISYDVTKSLLLHHEERLIKLLFPLNPHSCYLYPEIEKAINEVPHYKPSNELLSALRLQRAIACYQLKPTYLNILLNLHKHFKSKDSSLILYPQATVLIPQMIQIIYSELKAMNGNTLLGFRLNMEKYVTTLVEIVIAMKEAKDNLELETKQKPTKETKYKLSEAECKLSDLKQLLTQMVNIAKLSQKPSIEKITKLGININSLENENIERKAWEEYKSSKFDFINTRYDAVCNTYNEENSTFDPKEIEFLAQSITQYYENYQELVNLYLNSYGIDRDELRYPHIKLPFPPANICFDFKELFQYKTKLKKINDSLKEQIKTIRAAEKNLPSSMTTLEKTFDEEVFDYRQALEREKFVATSINTIRGIFVSTADLIKKIMTSYSSVKFNLRFYIYYVTQSNEEETFFHLISIKYHNISQVQLEMLPCIQNNRTGIISIIANENDMKRLRANPSDWPGTDIDISRIQKSASLSDFILSLPRISPTLIGSSPCREITIQEQFISMWEQRLARINEATIADDNISTSRTNPASQVSREISKRKFFSLEQNQSLQFFGQKQPLNSVSDNKQSKTNFNSSPHLKPDDCEEEGNSEIMQDISEASL